MHGIKDVIQYVHTTSVELTAKLTFAEHCGQNTRRVSGMHLFSWFHLLQLLLQIKKALVSLRFALFYLVKLRP